MSRPKTPVDWQAQIYQKHAGWIAGSHIHMAVGDGWADILSRLFDRIAEALASEPMPVKVAIVDVKEKYAELRCEILASVGPEAQAAIDRAILLAEMRSECTCDECGEPGVLRSTLGQSGWLAVKCDLHRSGYPRIFAKGPPKRRIRDRRGDHEVVYERESDTIVETPAGGMDSR